MRRVFEITEAAEQDLDRITDYLGVTLANPQAALAMLDEVEKINAELVSNPGIYPLCVPVIFYNKSTTLTSPMLGWAGSA